MVASSDDKKPLRANRVEVRPETLGRAERILPGTEGQNVPDDFSIPQAGIEDVDKALFNFFAKSLNLQVSYRNLTKMVPVVFAGSDRYAMTRSGRPIRDQSGAVVTPIIAIHRDVITQGMDPTMAFGVDTGDVVIRTRLAAEDRDYQRVVNRFGLKNQDDVASDANLQDLVPPQSIAKQGTVAARRRTGRHTLQQALEDPLNDNIYEIITVPTPNFMTLRYTVTFWTSYVVEMNQLIERVLAGHDVGSMYNARIESDKGYWYVAYFEDDWTMDDNFRDYTTQKKMVKSVLKVKVPAYTLASDGPGEPLPLRRFLSAPSFDFEVCDFDGTVESLVVQMPMLGPEDPAFMLSDVKEVPIDGRTPAAGERTAVATREFIMNPFATTQASAGPRYSRVVCRTQKGERVGRITDAILLDRLSKP